MLGYEWENNPSMIMLSCDENVQENNQNHQIFNPFSSVSSSQLPQYPSSQYHNHFFENPNGQEASNNTTHFPSLYDHHQTSPLSFEPSGSAGYMMIPKTEPVTGGVDFSNGTTHHTSRIGLNLGVRTYFSSDDDLVNRLYPRSRGFETGSINSPKCQAQGCIADLTHAKHYHRRHKVCEFHSKAATVIAGGLTQRFCQQCSRFHMLSEFDNGKRSCRRRLADHNRRRRKSHQQANQENANKSKLNSSPSESIIPISPPRISSVDYGSGSFTNE